MNFDGRTVLNWLSIFMLMYETRPSQGCDSKLVVSCPHYSKFLPLKTIPILDPYSLDMQCIEIKQLLRCILDSTVLGQCEASKKTPYTAMWKVIEIPCDRGKEEYLSKSRCWTNPEFTQLFTICFNPYMKRMNCGLIVEFIDCVRNGSTKIFQGDAVAGEMLSAMLLTWYNNVGTILKPECPLLDVPSWIITTAPTTTSYIDVRTSAEVVYDSSFEATTESIQAEVVYDSSFEATTESIHTISAHLNQNSAASLVASQTVYTLLMIKLLH